MQQPTPDRAPTLSVLLVEDDEDDREHVRDMLAESSSMDFELAEVERLADARQKVRVSPVDCVLLDLSLPDAEGLEALLLLLQTAPDEPIVVITASKDEDLAVQAVGEGAQDYLIKGQVDSRLIRRSIRYAIERKRAEVELERSNADLSAFTQVVSHDLKEPLRTVSTYVQLLARRYEGRLDENADELIGLTVEGVKRMQALIDGLLTYSEAETGEWSLAPVDCSALAEDTLDALGASIEASGATVTVEPLPAITVDRVQMGELFQNLLANAIKFNGDRPPSVRLEAQREPGGWCFWVIDSGPGIEPDKRDRIFGAFQRLHTREEYPGTGIGLTTCKKIVERHGGRIWVEPAPGGGSAFRFTIPDAGDAQPELARAETNLRP
jgi:signal transduction histidine kinase